MMDFVGLLFEIIFLGVGVYLYLFARGKISFSNPKTRENAARFRKSNASWLRILALALVAIMSLNVAVHLVQLFATN